MAATVKSLRGYAICASRLRRPAVAPHAAIVGAIAGRRAVGIELYRLNAGTGHCRAQRNWRSCSIAAAVTRAALLQSDRRVGDNSRHIDGRIHRGIALADPGLNRVRRATDRQAGRSCVVGASRGIGCARHPGAIDTERHFIEWRRRTRNLGVHEDGRRAGELAAIARATQGNAHGTRHGAAVVGTWQDHRLAAAIGRSLHVQRVARILRDECAKVHVEMVTDARRSTLRLHGLIIGLRGQRRRTRGQGLSAHRKGWAIGKDLVSQRLAHSRLADPSHQLGIIVAVGSHAADLAQ